MFIFTSQINLLLSIHNRLSKLDIRSFVAYDTTRLYIAGGGFDDEFLITVKFKNGFESAHYTKIVSSSKVSELTIYQECKKIIDEEILVYNTRYASTFLI
jgi:hypothetical protein